jgi:hypothetical protein
MKKIRNIQISSILVGLVGVLVAFSSVHAQEYDDMYFNKSDRKTIKSEKKALVSADLKSSGTANYNQATKSTEIYSAKNVNPEYIARYKATESNEAQEGNNSNYKSSDYFIENYNTPDSSIGIHQNQIDYAALNKRDQMSYSNYNNNFSNSNWRMNPYMNMGFGRPWGYSPYMMGYDPFMMGYDPFMMGYGPGMTMGMGYGFGTGFYPSMSYSIGMSWGTGYNPWGGWGGYPYSPYGMRGFYDPWAWGPSYGFGYSPYWGSGFGYGFNSFYGYPRPVYVVNKNEYYNNNVSYQPRTVRNTSTPRVATSNSENVRVSSADSKIRVPNTRTVATNTADGRISRDYSKSQNEYYNTSRRTTSSSERIATSTSNRNAYTRTSGSATGYTSPISNTKPDRLSNSSSGINRSTSGNSNSSFTSPNRSGSSYDRSSYSSGNNSSSYSSGSRSSFSGGSSSGARSAGTPSSGATRSGGRQ